MVSEAQVDKGQGQELYFKMSEIYLNFLFLCFFFVKFTQIEI